jgi:hypothetical protein
MLSPGLSQVLERARTRYALDVEILDGELRSVYPDTGTELGRAVRDTPELRGSLRDTVLMGNSRELDIAGRRFRVSPLRCSRMGDRGGLLAISGDATSGPLPDSAPWYEFVKAAVEADVSTADALRDERQGSRRLLAILRFLRYLLDASTEAELAQALVQAAAVWFDVDARIYRRELSGDFALVSWLPGVDPDTIARQVDGHLVGAEREVRRLPATPDLVTQSSVGEVVLVPLTGSASVDWVLTLAGAVPQEAESVFPVIARVVGVQLEALRSRRVNEARLRFETIVRQSSLAAERLALQLVGEVVRTTGADAATLTLVRDGESRRIVSFGPHAEEPHGVQDDTWVMQSERFICALPLAGSQRAVLEVRPAAGAVLGRDAADVAAVFARVLQTWLVGATSSFVDATDVIDVPEPVHTAPGPFEKRIEEELERAKRFDLDLSLVLVDLASPSPAVAQIVEALRRELRGSDLLGTMSGRQVAALLTHTDDRGLDNVVARVRRRLADAADRLNIADVRVGQAAFSADCRTAAALVSRAVREAEPIVVH